MCSCFSRNRKWQWKKLSHSGNHIHSDCESFQNWLLFVGVLEVLCNFFTITVSLGMLFPFYWSAFGMLSFSLPRLWSNLAHNKLIQLLVLASESPASHTGSDAPTHAVALLIPWFYMCGIILCSLVSSSLCVMIFSNKILHLQKINKIYNVFFLNFIMPFSLRVSRALIPRQVAIAWHCYCYLPNANYVSRQVSAVAVLQRPTRGTESSASRCSERSKRRTDSRSWRSWSSM